MTLFANYSPSGESPELELAKAMAAEPERRKCETYWAGLSILLTVDITYNLISTLKAIPPTSGTILSSSKLIDLTSNKIKPFNESKSMWVKLALKGTYAGGATNREMECSFILATPDVFTASRVPTPPQDYYTFTNLISVDRFGFAATNGMEVTLKPTGGNFTLNEVKLIVEQ